VTQSYCIISNEDEDSLKNKTTILAGMTLTTSFYYCLLGFIVLVGLVLNGFIFYAIATIAVRRATSSECSQASSYLGPIASSKSSTFVCLPPNTTVNSSALYSDCRMSSFSPTICLPWLLITWQSHVTWQFALDSLFAMSSLVKLVSLSSSKQWLNSCS